MDNQMRRLNVPDGWHSCSGADLGDGTVSYQFQDHSADSRAANFSSRGPSYELDAESVTTQSA